MDKNNFNSPISLKNVMITDTFWKSKMELVRSEMIPYQWAALNDQVVGAAPSFCMHNFKTAAKQNKEKKENGSSGQAATFTFRGFEALPEDPNHLEDKFYGFVFQDSDFYKWIEAVGYSLTQHPDEKLEALADDAINIVCAAQQEDGYLDTYYILNGKDKIFSDLRDHHELYCLGHLIEGAVAYYEATGKRKLLDAACGYANYATNFFGPEEHKMKGYPGHEIAEMALVRLYEVTNNEKYLKLSRFFIDERGKHPYYFDKEHPLKTQEDKETLRYHYHQAHLPVHEQTEAVGHAVRAVYLYSGMADIARLTGDESLYLACGRLWDSVVNQKMYLTGGIGATHIGEAFSFPYDLPNDTAYAETCASIGLIFWARRMLEIRPDSKYADVMERALYNCVLSGMSLDGKSFFYVNPLAVNPEACHNDERLSHVKPVRQKWFGCACCPPNLARILSSVSSYAYTEKEDTLFVHLYIGGIIKKQIQGKTAVITVSSDLPWNGNVSIHVNADQIPFTLALRIPDWCSSYTLTGIEGAKQEIKDGYLYLTKNWSSKDILSLEFPMEIQFLQADFRVRENIGKAAVLRGPVVYCLESADNKKPLHLLRIDCSKETRTDTLTINGEIVTAILASGYQQELPAEVKNGKLYEIFHTPLETSISLKLVPYYVWGNRGENEMMVWIRT